jgi:hypothetical protein
MKFILILLARSEYFARMFGSNFKELVEKVVKIQEPDEALFKLLIKMMYFNDFSALTYELSMDLIVLAQKYIFSRLIESCSKTILNNLKIQTCIDILVVAESLESKELKNAAINFAVRNLKGVMETEKWKELAVKDPAKALEITTKFINDFVM